MRDQAKHQIIILCIGDDLMKPASTLRAALAQFMPEALYRLPPEEAPRGTEEAVRVFQPVGNLREDQRPASLTDAGQDELPADVRELEEMFEFGPEVAEALPALGGAEAERVRQAVLAKGVEALGWYVPFHVIGVQWGIYIPIRSLAYVAGNVFSGVSADVATRIRLAFRMIHQHELYHFAVEYALTQLELILGIPLHVERKRLRDPTLGYIVSEERAANAWMLRSVRSAKRSMRQVGRARALRRFISAQPAGYRDAAEIVEEGAFRAACRGLVLEYLPFESQELKQNNLDWLFPISPRIDWRQCPVHIIDDSKRLVFAPRAFDLFPYVRGIVRTESFQAALRRLPRPLQKAWEKTERILGSSTAIGGLNFKLWERRPSGRVYAVRVSDSCRAHLRYDEKGIWFAEEIGMHAAMGHG